MDIVTKVWGHEEWIVNNNLYCGKRLILNKGWQCSLHYHEKKTETFYVDFGCVLMELGNERFTLRRHSNVTVLPGVKHRFSGLEDSVIIEFSTHHDDADTFRVAGQQSRRI